ncbi:MAG TPA: riboflavin synthase [Rhodospirillaceae bacterium]|nr:riboflavin synthase [Rhodospirillaceae bacterium]
MFTGLVQDVGTVCSIENRGVDLRLEIETNIDLKKVSSGASIAVSGVCLTATEIKKNCFFTDVSAETLRKTIIKDWRVGERVNIEPSLRLGDELGGHFVFGHVDGTAEIMNIKEEGQSYMIKVKAPRTLMPYIAQKGSVALDGISLTVNEVGSDYFTVNIIPQTWAKTTIGMKKAGDLLNIEIDMLARYVARMLGKEAA